MAGVVTGTATHGSARPYRLLLQAYWLEYFSRLVVCAVPGMHQVGPIAAFFDLQQQ